MGCGAGLSNGPAARTATPCGLWEKGRDPIAPPKHVLAEFRLTISDCNIPESLPVQEKQNAPTFSF
jgi:hypothetical protein